MEMSGTIVDHIIEIKDSLPKKQRQLCNYIVLHSGEAGMMTVAELAQHAGVGTTTVMRLVQDLGYDSYNRLKRDIMSASMRQLGSSYGNRMQTLSFDSKSGKEHTLEHVLTDFRQVSVNLLTQNNQEQFNKAVDLLLKASWINVLGLRSSQVAALYFEYAVGLFYPKVRQLSTEQEYLFDRLLLLHSDDVLLVISQWPCTKKTIDAALVCHRRNIPIILVTNTRINPIAEYASAVIDTDSVSSSSDILPVMAVMEALSYESGKRTAPQSTENMTALEEMLRENHLILWDSV